MKLCKNPRIAIAGSVNSTLRTYKKLIEHNCNLVGVLGLDPNRAKNVSGYVDLKSELLEEAIPFKHFSKINSEEIYNFLKDLDIDLFFVIGLSQLIKEPLLSLAKYGNVGFHPTKLPNGRGRGAVAWLVLGVAEGAATFFLLDEGMDSGPILGQKVFKVEKDDYAKDVVKKLLLKTEEALDDFLPQLNEGRIDFIIQDEKKATYLGQRKPIDGKIDWDKDCESIYALIRASSSPFPGAFSYINESKMRIDKARVEKDTPYFGIPGRIINIKNDEFLVACGKGAIWLTDFEFENEINLRIGLDFSN